MTKIEKIEAVKNTVGFDEMSFQKAKDILIKIELGLVEAHKSGAEMYQDEILFIALMITEKVNANS